MTLTKDQQIEALRTALWSALKRQCCVNPDTAVCCVTVQETDLAKALDSTLAATEPAAEDCGQCGGMGGDEKERCEACHGTGKNPYASSAQPAAAPVSAQQAREEGT